MFFLKKPLFRQKSAVASNPIANGGKPAFVVIPQPEMSPRYDLTTGNMTKNLLHLSWPLIISNTLFVLGSTMDIIWIGRLGEAAVAGVGVSIIGLQLLIALMLGLHTGIRAIIARYIGAKDYLMANQVLKQSLVVGLISSAILTSIGLLFNKLIFTTLDLSPDVIAAGVPYLNIIFYSIVLMMLRGMMESAMQATGDVFHPMLVTLVYRLAHIALSPMLIFGAGIFPKMGVEGSAVSFFITQLLGLILMTWTLNKTNRFLRVELRHFNFNKDIIWRLFKVSTPSAIMGAQSSVGAFMLIRFFTPFGTTVVAAHSIFARLDLLVLMPITGLGIAAGVLAGQNLGANKPERAIKSTWYAVLISEAFMLVWALTLFVGAVDVMRVFTNEPGLIAAGADFLRIAAVSYLFISLTIVFQYCISGAGDTVPPMIVSVIGIWVLLIPPAYFFSQNEIWGVYGIRWTMVASNFVIMLIYLFYFLRGRWKTKKV